MAVFYKEGEVKIRPGIYQRYSKTGADSVPGAQDGICAIPVQASWGPLGAVVRNASGDLEKTYGTGAYRMGYTVPAAQALFSGGASTVYTYRLGTGGTKASLDLMAGENAAVTATAKYEGTMPISISVQAKLGDEAAKVVNVYAQSALVESFTYAADGKNEPKNLVKACQDSRYVTFTLKGEGAGTLDSVAVAAGELTGGANPTVTNADYSKAFAAFEPYYYNCITLDVDDDDSLSKSLLLQAYLDHAYEAGKLGMAVVGEKTTVDFATRVKHAAAFNDEKVVYLGSGWRTVSGDLDGVMAICRTAGAIAATPSNRSVVHSVIDGATEVLENLTYAQYVEAIETGMLLPSMSGNGRIWYDSGVNTLVSPSEEQDDGWKKIRRTKTRFEMFHRLDAALAPKVGRINCDADGVGDVIQTANRVLAAMETENKIAVGASFIVDPDHPYGGDSAWFIVDADDYDSLEKIYLQYRFRFSQA